MDQEGDNDITEISDYFRTNIRKLSTSDALSLSILASKIESFDEDFWVWETCEEAIRPHIHSMTDEQVHSVIVAFKELNKGSDELWNNIDTFVAGKYGPFQSAYDKWI